MEAGWRAPHGWTQLLHSPGEPRAESRTIPQQHGHPAVPHQYTLDLDCPHHVILHRPCGACHGLFLAVTRVGQEGLASTQHQTAATTSEVLIHLVSAFWLLLKPGCQVCSQPPEHILEGCPHLVELTQEGPLILSPAAVLHPLPGHLVQGGSHGLGTDALQQTEPVSGGEPCLWSIKSPKGSPTPSTPFMALLAGEQLY